VGGNQYLQRQYGCPAWSTPVEAAISRFPELEPTILYGGFPFSELCHKFLMAQPSDVREFGGDDFPSELEIIALPGHFLDMVGVRTPDGTVFLADSVAGQPTLEKYKFTFIYDVAQFLKTLDMIDTLEGKVFVPSHADAVEDVRKLTDVNRRTVLEIAEAIVEECAEPIMWEELLQRMLKKYDRQLNCEQYVLVGSTLRSYLSWLKESGRLSIVIDDYRLLWKAV